MSVEANKAIVRRWWEEAWSKANLDLADELIHEDHKHREHGTPLKHHAAYKDIYSDLFHGPKGQKELISAYHAAFANLKFEVDDLIAEGDKVVSVWTASGTLVAEFMGIPPTGAPGELKGVSVMHIVNGKIRDHLLIWDGLSLLHQLGATISPPSAATPHPAA